VNEGDLEKLLPRGRDGVHLPGKWRDRLTTVLIVPYSSCRVLQVHSDVRRCQTRLVMVTYHCWQQAQRVKMGVTHHLNDSTRESNML
jgi:hypothetical protein